MNILLEAIRLISQPPGDVVYFLVTLFALQQAFFAVMSARRATSDAPLVQRWGWAIGGVLAGRLLLILASLLGNAGVFTSELVIPPLEQAVNFASLALIIWAGVWGGEPEQWQTYVLLTVLTASLLFYGYSAYAWVTRASTTLAFEGQPLAMIGDGLAVLLWLILLGAAATFRPAEWEWFIGLAVFALLGYGAQFLWPDPTLHFSGWLRLTSLVTLPLLSLIVYRQLTVNITPAGGTFIPDAPLLQEVLFGVESAREIDSTLILTSAKLARLLDADLCVIAFHPPRDHTKVKVIAIHPPTPAQIDLPELNLMDYPQLAESYASHKPRILQGSSAPLWLDRLYRHLGVEQSGPLVVAPLCNQDDCLGILLLGNPESERLWSVPSLPAYDLVAHLLAEAIFHAQKRIEEAAALQRQRTQREAELRNLQSELEASQQKITSLNNRINVLANEIKLREREIQRLTNRLTRPKAQSKEISFWQNEVRSLAAERDALKKKVDELSRDRAVLNEERGRLLNELSEAQSQLEVSLELQRQLEHRIRELEAQRERLSKQSHDLREIALGMLVTDRKGRVVTADVFAHRILNLPTGNIIGVSLKDIYPTEEWAQAVTELLSTKPGARRRAHFMLTQLGELVAADLVSLLGAHNEPTGLLLTVRTPGGVIEQQQVIVSLVNEFRSPMTAITGYTDLLLGEQAGLLTEMQKQFLYRVKANVEHLGQLLNDLLYLTSPESRPLELRPVPLNLAKLASEAVIGLSARFRERNLTVRMDIPANLPEVPTDREGLYQIFSRLLTNAVQCSRENSEIVIRARQEHYDDPAGEYVHVEIHDTCGGIAPEDYSRVFRRFYRANQPLVQGLGEKGIGMAIVKTLVEGIGGRIWVESEPGKGSAFHFILPL